MVRVRGLRPEIAAHADSALRLVRLVLGVLSCFVLGTYRPLTSSPRWWSLTGLLATIIAVVLALNWISKRFQARSGSGWAVQALDVCAVVALALLLAGPLGHQSWILLAVPIVSAGVRIGTAASVVSWVVGCGGYIAAVLLGAAGEATDLTLLARIPGALLTVAITIGLLARWMREGWEIQTSITEAVAVREQRLAVIERTANELKNLSPDQAVEVCASQILALGFEGATIEYLSQDRPMLQYGEAAVVARGTTTSTADDYSQPVVTVWMQDDEVHSYSVTLHETATQTLLTGWSRLPIDAEAARAFATLVAHTSTAAETATLLSRLRHTATHDALTGLANRRALDHELQALAAQPGRLGVGFVDLDDFKDINDRYGHDTGDKALMVIAARLKAAAKPGDLIARYGGDEFVILMPNADIDEVHRVGAAVLAASAHPVALGATQLNLRLSIGVVSAETPIDIVDLLTAVDQAMYQAKKAGKATLVATNLGPITTPIVRQLASGSA